MVDPHLMFAANFVMREAYKEAADVIRRGGTLAEAMQKVPTIKRIEQVMGGRRQIANLHAHHTAPQYWMRQLVPGITQSQLDDMPALLLDEAWHQQLNGAEMNRNRVSHNILGDEMRNVRSDDVEDIIRRLRRTYRKFYGILDDADPDPDFWVVTEKWIRSQPNLGGH